MVFYCDTKTEVCVGDYVKIKVWLEFWRGWQSGRVYYVPDISPINENLEFNGLTWVAIHYHENKQTGVLVEPKTNSLNKKVRFLKRADDGFIATPENYYFGDNEK